MSLNMQDILDDVKKSYGHELESRHREVRETFALRCIQAALHQAKQQEKPHGAR